MNGRNQAGESQSMASQSKLRIGPGYRRCAA